LTKAAPLRSRAKDAEPGFRHPHASQRFQMYIVTSKPKRNSTNVGLLQTIDFS
jgi:hypothetical protein